MTVFLESRKDKKSRKAILRPDDTISNNGASSMVLE